MDNERINRVANDLRAMTPEEIVVVVGCLLLTSGSATTTSIASAFWYALSVPDEAIMKATPDLYLQACGEHKIRVIKVLRERLGLGLKEAKELADSAPCRIAAEAELSPTQQKALCDDLVAVGATVR